jgi:hypothetical protein
MPFGVNEKGSGCKDLNAPQNYVVCTFPIFLNFIFVLISQMSLAAKILLRCPCFALFIQCSATSVFIMTVFWVVTSCTLLNMWDWPFRGIHYLYD